MRMFLALVCVLISQPSLACLHSSKARAQFMKENPCPANGKHSGPCKGWIVDHVVPLCAGGADTPANMQWQTIADAKVKDKIERKQCASTFMSGDRESR
jgi:hypothetical protein